MMLIAVIAVNIMSYSINIPFKSTYKMSLTILNDILILIQCFTFS